jgi:hypothetical protein
VRSALPVALLVLAGVLYRGRGDVVQPLRPPVTPRLLHVVECRQERPMLKDEVRAEVPPEPEAQRSGSRTPSTSAAGLEPLSVVPPLLSQLEAEIRDCHDRYRRMGVLDVRDYGWWVADRKALWFQRVDAVLDRRQHELWVALQQKNLLGQGLDFEVSEGMAILE